MQRRLLRPRLKLRLTRRSEVASAEPQPPLTVTLQSVRRSRSRGLGASVKPFLATLSVAIFFFWPTQSAATLPANDLAEFIVNIARYTSWPSTASPKSLTVCYAHGGAAPIASPISANDWTVKGISVNWLAISSPQQVAGCNIVWLNSDVRPAPRAWIAAVTDQPVLTLSNYADFTADGGIIGAYRVGTDWRFEVNLEALQRSHINIAAVALRLSQKPRTSAAAGETR